jgi:hypothetical protein
MGDNFDYMSKVDKEHYIDDSFDYDMVAHNIDYAQASMDDYTAHTIDTMHDEVDNLYTMPHKTTSSKVEWPRFEQGTTYFDSISSSHQRQCHHDKRPLAHQDTRDHQIVHQAQRQHDLPRQPSRRHPQYTSSFTALRITDMFTDTTIQQIFKTT